MSSPARLVSVFTLLFLLSLASFTSRSTVAEAFFICDPPDLVIDAEELRVLDLINAYRAEYGLQPLVLSENLNRSAGWHAGDMGSRNYFSHTDWFGRSFDQRIRDCEVNSVFMGEDIAAGNAVDRAEEVFRMWQNSPPHNAIMLGADFTRIGISRYYGPSSTYGWYWVIDLAGD